MSKMEEKKKKKPTKKDDAKEALGPQPRQIAAGRKHMQQQAFGSSSSFSATGADFEGVKVKITGRDQVDGQKEGEKPEAPHVATVNLDNAKFGPGTDLDVVGRDRRKCGDEVKQGQANEFIALFKEIQATRKSSESSAINVLIFVAMTEELRYLREVLESRKIKISTELRDDMLVRTFIYANRVCGILCAETMAMVAAATLVTRAVEKFSPAYVINVGISGSMGEDAKVGDVVVAEQINNVLEAAAIEDVQPVEDTATSSHDHRTVRIILSLAGKVATINHHMRNFASPEFDPDGFHRWQNEMEELARAKDLKVPEIASSRIRYPNKLEVVTKGHLVASDLVFKSTAMQKFIREHGVRGAIAVDMESGGVGRALDLLGGSVKYLPIRGISDTGDLQKGVLDNFPGGKATFRVLAMTAASLWMLVTLDNLTQGTTQG